MSDANDIIVVTFNYRIGALGFMASPQIEAVEQQSGNYGVQDTIAVLQWVKNNIAEFGGDPGKVTLASQSSGSTNTCRLLVDPAASGLFRAAVLSSEDCIHDVDTKAAAVKRANDLTAKLGCSAGTDQEVVDCMRSKPFADIAAEGGEWNPYSVSTLKHGWAVEEIEAGSYANKVPVMVGSTRDEGRSSGKTFVNDASYATDADFERWANRLLRDSAGMESSNSLEQQLYWSSVRINLVNIYKPSTEYFSEPADFRVGYAIGDFITDSGMRGLGGCTNLRLAEALAPNVDTYFYQFEYKTAPQANEFDSLSSHGSEVAYLWTANPGSFTPEQAALSELMIAYWGAFAKNMNPNVTGLPPWPKMTDDRTTAQQMWLQGPDALTGTSVAKSTNDFYTQHNCGTWLLYPDRVITDRGNKDADVSGTPAVMQPCTGKTGTSCQ